MLHIISFTLSIVIAIAGFTVIEGPPIVIFRPNETPVVLMCNISGAITAWRVNNSTATLPGDVPNAFPGHTVNGGNLMINTPTNNTKYICVSVESNGTTTNSDPVLLYMAGMLNISLSSYAHNYICLYNT